MAHAYTPGLKVLHYSNVKKDRRLPIKGQVNKKKGDLVNANDVVAKTDLPGNVSMVKVANLLNIAPSDINDIQSYPFHTDLHLKPILLQFFLLPHFSMNHRE